MTPLLSVRNLTTTFSGRPVVDGVSFDLGAGEVLALVGESGSGKSVTALSVLRLVMPPGRIAGGTIQFEGTDLLRLSPRALRQVRGSRIGMVFQEPATALNPVFTIGDQIMETLQVHRRLGRADARREAQRLLERVELPAAARRLDDYPHQLSGGMRQRVMIAMALACSPRLLIADEPTTALDVTVQAQIMDLLRDLRRDLKMAVLLITHDLGVVAELAQRVIVLYAGRVVEDAPVGAIYASPRHPYTRGLLAAVPRIDGPRQALNAVPGTVPAPGRRPQGCSFRPRCDQAVADCAASEPDLVEVAAGCRVACIRAAA